jgi:glycosyltransferase involved in cell wall biosynthesis
MTSAEPRVSIVIPLYNKERTIARTLDSIRAQTLSDFETIIVDDGSTDGSVECVERSGVDADPRFRLVRQTNAGPGAARNAGARLARGKYLAFIDADDEWKPTYLERALAALAREPACRMHVVIYEAGTLHRHPLANLLAGSGRWTLPPDLGPVETKAFVDACQVSCVVLELDLFRRYGGFYDKNRSTFGEDIYFFIQVVFGTDIYFETEPLVHFHVEDSELGLRRASTPPLRPHLLEPEPLLRSCPPARVTQLRALFAYYRLLETEKYARCGDVRRVLSLRRQYPWPSGIPKEFRRQEIKIPLRALAGAVGFKRSE